MSRILVVNAGSSSLKLSVLEAGHEVLSQTVGRWQGQDHLEPVEAFAAAAGPLDAVGHRVVHGGPRHRGPAVIDPGLLAELDALTELAPLHQPRSLAGIAATGRLLPQLPAVACFDTAFHADLPPAVATYALPAEWNDRWGLRRYGFHGLSHGYAARRAAQTLERPSAGLRLVSCHLGAGGSLCAVRDGRSVDTTMGFTPLEGLVMQTRVGSVDPGLLLWLLRTGRVTVDELEDALEHRSGLAGLSGTSGDLRDVVAAVDAGSAPAALAWDVCLHRIAREVAAMTIAAGGLDVLVLTGGLGEHSPALRADLAMRLAHLGVAVDVAANDLADADADITAPGSPVRTLVVTAREDLEIAAQVTGLLAHR